MSDSNEIKKQAAADRAMSYLADTLPPLWWNLYKGCYESGFSPTESFQIVQTYIMSTGVKGINLPDTFSNGTDTKPKE